MCCTKPTKKKYATFLEAKNDCKDDEKCTYIHDQSCNRKEYILCHGGNIATCSGEDSCVWIKGKKFCYLS